MDGSNPRLPNPSAVQPAPSAITRTSSGNHGIPTVHTLPPRPGTASLPFQSYIQAHHPTSGNQVVRTVNNGTQPVRRSMMRAARLNDTMYMGLRPEGMPGLNVMGVRVASASSSQTPRSLLSPQPPRSIPSTLSFLPREGASTASVSPQLPLPNTPSAPNTISQPGFRPMIPTEIALEMLREVQLQHAQKRSENSEEERPTKRQALIPAQSFPISNGRLVLSEDISDADFVCCLCFSEFKEPHITGCGHTFCYSCIRGFMSMNGKCPICTIPVKPESIVPNRAIYQLMRKKIASDMNLNNEVATAVAHVPESTDPLGKMDLQAFFQKKYKELSIGEVDILMAMLSRKKEVLMTESEECRKALIVNFLTELKHIKEAELRKVLEELHFVESDLVFVKKSVKEVHKNDETALQTKVSVDNQVQSTDDIETFLSSSLGEKGDTVFSQIENIQKDILDLTPSVVQRKVKMHSHLTELSGMYFKSCRGWNQQEIRLADAKDSTGGLHMPEEKRLENFCETLVQISRYSGFKVLATLAYTSDTLMNASIVSTIEFDKDRDFFAIAGVTKKIKLFEYGSVIASTVNMQCPNGEILCSSKISCVSYCCFFKNKLASSDYDGRVNLWDTSNCCQTSMLNEHEKRVWSIDFSDMDPRFLVSGSDDCKVKLWAINQQKSALTLNADANVCCVKFLPGSSYMVAYGAADHCIHYYDFRQPKYALRVYDGHKKAVSYVKFASKTEIISASTDSNLKLWDLNEPECVRSYVGHVNEKNFVGLTTDGTYLACGSENNSVYVYHKQIADPIMSYKFENYRSMIHPVRQEEISSEFVSAVAWRTGSPVIVAANSQGIIKVLELL